MMLHAISTLILLEKVAVIILTYEDFLNYIRSITCYSYILMISLDRKNKMADYLINRH